MYLAIFNFTSHQWIHIVHLEDVNNLCNGQGMPKNYVGAGDVVLLNQDPSLRGTAYLSSIINL